MKFYKINKPTTAQFIEAIENKEYFTSEQLDQKRNQLRTILEAKNCCEMLITYTNVTNSGGYPIIFKNSESYYDVASSYYDDFYDMTEEEQEEIISNLSFYTEPL